ncbi:FUSC family protein [Leucobacter sp. CSA1]|uniref:FUSC family protein n=1 Tax=Leucobacter chromiisoli TaxID=2796471 RepID=A0A934Q6W2_9MICO|nr:FUSC family protein [Leucobacter chromiisoli]MBK0418793.1 FUSC family protein [Leucobacter chromiisoli]
MTRIENLRGAVARTGRQVGNPSRLVLAVKTAAAAAIAWYFAPYVPLAESEYSYYAPLGVLVSMYSTVVDSVRTGLQTLLGLGAGIVLGLGALTFVTLGVPAIVSMALLVAGGVALGGLQIFGAGRDWIALAGIMVLLLGGRNADDFSFSYLATMGFGVLVGLIVQLLAVPPLYLSEARTRLSDLRRALGDCLEETATAVEDGRRDSGALQEAIDSLTGTATAASEEIRQAQRSRRVNPRARRRGHENEDIDAQFRSLDHVVFFVRALSDLIEQRTPDQVPAAAKQGGERLAEAIRQCGALLSMPVDAEDRETQVTRTRQALRLYLHGFETEGRADPSAFADEMAAGVCLRRIIEELE